MDGSRVSPVFYDPERKRWPRIRGGLVVAASVFTVLAAILILSILIILRCPLCIYLRRDSCRAAGAS
jgi:hypothetical protein